MTDWIEAGLVCAATAAVGWPWASYLTGQQLPALARVAVAWLAGAALVTLGMLVVVYPGLSLDRATVAAAFAGTFALGWVLDQRRPARAATSCAPGSMRAAVIPAAVSLAALAYGTLLAFRLGPVDSTDYVKAWGLKGVYAYQEQGLTFSGHSGPHIFYPLLVSNLNGAVYIALGHVDDTVVRLPGALFGLALAGVTWWLVRLRAPPMWAAIAVCLVVTTPEFTTTMTSGLADLTTAAYLTAAVMAAYLWVVTGPGSTWAAFSGFMAGGAAWAKLEGAPSAMVLLIVVMILRRNARTPGASAWLLWMAVFIVPWQLFMRLHDIPLNRSHFAKLYVNVWWIAEHVTRTLAETSHWGLFWPFCVAIVALSAPFWWRSEWRALAVLVIPNLILTAAAYVTHYRAGVAGSVEATADRLYLHLAPATATLAATAAMTACARLAPWLERVQVLRAGHDQPAGGGDHR